MNRWTIRRAATTALLYATAAAILVVIVFPIYWMFSSSVKTELEFFALPPTWFPSPSIENYVAAFRTRPLHRYIINSVVITHRDDRPLGRGGRARRLRVLPIPDRLEAGTSSSRCSRPG